MLLSSISCRQVDCMKATLLVCEQHGADWTQCDDCFLCPESNPRLTLPSLYTNADLIAGLRTVTSAKYHTFNI